MDPPSVKTPRHATVASPTLVEGALDASVADSRMKDGILKDFHMPDRGDAAVV